MYRARAGEHILIKKSNIILDSFFQDESFLFWDIWNETFMWKNIKDNLWAGSCLPKKRWQTVFKGMKPFCSALIMSNLIPVSVLLFNCCRSKSTCFTSWQVSASPGEGRRLKRQQFQIPLICLLPSVLFFFLPLLKVIVYCSQALLERTIFFQALIMFP